MTFWQWNKAILLVCVMTVAVCHAVWGISLLIGYHSVAWITAVSHLVSTCGLGNPTILGAELLAAGLVAVVVLVRDPQIGRRSAIALIPQQLLLLFASIGIIQSVMASAFADGEVRPRAFIFNDQFPALWLAVMHTGALVLDYFEPSIRHYLERRSDTRSDQCSGS